ncbi:MAG: tRNA (guanosine(46)-N7)-methyltransferase TrmB [Bacilli bacterium]|nr:tRNA (guanosine(46)-N7)-methyltransferase TrmB [Bacilli bacterium]
MRARKKKWVSPYLESHPELDGESFDPAPFKGKSPLYLEIGTGKGDFIVAQSQKIEGTYIGLERDEMVLSIAHKKVVSSECKEVYLYRADFDFLFERLSGLSFDIIYLNFSDPWPKKRHEKRRLTFAPRLRNIVSLLSEKGELRIKTDNDTLFEFTLEQAVEVGLHEVSVDKDYQTDSETDSVTEYEAAWRGKGKNIYRMVYTK